MAFDEPDLHAVEEEAEDGHEEGEGVGVEGQVGRWWDAGEVHGDGEALLVSGVAGLAPGGEQDEEVNNAEGGEGVDAEAGAVAEAEEADADEGGGDGETKIKHDGGRRGFQGGRGR